MKPQCSFDIKSKAARIYRKVMSMSQKSAGLYSIPLKSALVEWTTLIPVRTLSHTTNVFKSLLPGIIPNPQLDSEQ